jgi:tetratricopeptide (TPR) repeat protein
MDDKWLFKFRRQQRIEGKPMTFEEAEEYLLSKLNDPSGDPHHARLELVQFYGTTDRVADAMSYAEDYLTECTDLKEKAEIHFHQGQMMERVRDWESALLYYKKALELSSQAEIDRYFLHNNIGYSLNQLKRHCEAEPHLREAIRLDPSRANAFKNLGLSLEGQGQFAEAARNFIAAVRANASDPRALRHLEELAGRHKEVNNEIADLDYQIFKCREAVEYAASQKPPSPFRVH